LASRKAKDMEQKKRSEIRRESCRGIQTRRIQRSINSRIRDCESRIRKLQEEKMSSRSAQHQTLVMFDIARAEGEMEGLKKIIL